MLALVLSLLFWASPSTDVARYECESFEMHMEAATCPAGSCQQISAPRASVCLVVPPQPPSRDYQAMTASPAPGQVVAFCVRAVDYSGNASPCVGGL